jgi:hypothetical protein
MINSLSLKSDAQTVSPRLRQHLREMALNLVFSEDPASPSA